MSGPSLSQNDQLLLERIIEAIILNVKPIMETENLTDNYVELEYCIDNDKLILAVCLRSRENPKSIFWWDPNESRGKKEKYSYISPFYFRGKELFQYLKYRLGQILAAFPQHHRVRIKNIDIENLEGYSFKGSCRLEIYKIQIG